MKGTIAAPDQRGDRPDDAGCDDNQLPVHDDCFVSSGRRRRVPDDEAANLFLTTSSHEPRADSESPPSASPLLRA